ncbi:MAG: hypothetical protein GX457_17915 [Thermotogaceae bacterium]|nr:hypothetical protein [Thermotogaceae bacterium]
MIKVKAKKVVKQNYPQPCMIEVEKLRGLSFYNLPHKYKASMPFCYFGDGKVFIRTESFNRDISEGALLNKEEWGNMIAALSSCGNRLKGINEEIRQETEGWSGDIEVNI